MLGCVLKHAGARQGPSWELWQRISACSSEEDVALPPTTHHRKVNGAATGACMGTLMADADYGQCIEAFAHRSVSEASSKSDSRTVRGEQCW